MKTLFIITSFIGLSTTIHFKIINIKLSNELSFKNDTIISLKQEKFIKDSLTMNLEDFFSDNEYKDCSRFKKIYFNR